MAEYILKFYYRTIGWERCPGMKESRLPLDRILENLDRSLSLMLL